MSERRALQSEAMGLCLGAAACKLTFLERTTEKKASAEPGTKQGIEPVRLRAFFQAHLSIDTMSSFLL
jgi:hypothetical protein